MRDASTPALHTSIRISINMQIREAAASQQNASALHNYAIQREQQRQHQRDMQTRFTHVATFRPQPSAPALAATPATTAAASSSAGHPLPCLAMRGMLIGVTGQGNSSKVFILRNRILALPVNNFLLRILLFEE